MSDGKPRPYQVAITARADRDVPEKIAAACVEFLFGPLAGNPHRLGKPLREISPDCTRLDAAATESSTPSMAPTTASR